MEGAITISLPAPTAFSEPLEQVLACLAALTGETEATWVSSVAISGALRDIHSIGIHWRTLDVLLQDKSLASRRKRNKRWEYRLLADGRARISTTHSQITLVEPERALNAVRTTHSILGALKGEVRLCDPYFDHVSIEHLSTVPLKVPLFVLTVNIYEQSRVKRLLAAAKTEGRSIEVRVLPPGTLHDRYLIDHADFLILGTSLNSLGKKQSFLVRGGEDMRMSMLATFSTNWVKATPWP